MNDARLLPQHLVDLRKSGLSDDYIARARLYSVWDSETVRQTLRWARYKDELGSALAIPFVDASGNLTGYIRLKPDRPRKDNRNGKAIKYESPKGVPNQAYFP